MRSAMIRCGKALMRSRLRGGENRVARSDVPTIGAMLPDQANDRRLPIGQTEMVETYKKTLY